MFDKFRQYFSTKYCIIFVEVMNMNFKEAYEKSLRMIKEFKITNLKDYTTLAKEKNLLSATSLEYISRKEFNNLIKEVHQS